LASFCFEKLYIRYVVSAALLLSLSSLLICYLLGGLYYKYVCIFDIDDFVRTSHTKHVQRETKHYNNNNNNNNPYDELIDHTSHTKHVQRETKQQTTTTTTTTHTS